MRLSKKTVRRIKVLFRDLWEKGGDLFMPRRGARFIVKGVENSPGQFCFILKAPNGEVIATSEVYDSLQGCLKGVKAVKKYSKTAKVEKPSVK